MCSILKYVYQALIIILFTIVCFSYAHAYYATTEDVIALLGKEIEWGKLEKELEALDKRLHIELLVCNKKDSASTQIDCIARCFNDAFENVSSDTKDAVRLAILDKVPDREFKNREEYRRAFRLTKKFPVGEMLVLVALIGRYEGDMEEVIKLREKNMSYEEIARLLGVSLEKVRDDIIEYSGVKKEGL